MITLRVTYLSKEALVVTHRELCLKLSECLKRNAYNDDKRGSAEGEYTGKLLSKSLEVGNVACIACVAGEIHSMMWRIT